MDSRTADALNYLRIMVDAFGPKLDVIAMLFVNDPGFWPKVNALLANAEVDDA